MENARGNSGTLVAVMLSALAESLEGVDRLTAQTLALALDRATVRSWAALSEPVAGTMLSVLETTATTVRTVAADVDESGHGLRVALEHMVAAAVEAVRETESQLKALEAATWSILAGWVCSCCWMRYVPPFSVKNWTQIAGWSFRVWFQPSTSPPECRAR